MAERYSEVMMDHFMSPRNWGKLGSPDFIGVAGVPGRGRYLVLHVRVESKRVIEVAYHCHGCGATIASGSMLTELIKGKPLESCRKITAGQLVRGLQGLPTEKMHCASFAIHALREALSYA